MLLAPGVSMRLAISLVILAAGCSRPPPAPEGLDASSNYLIENFYSSDAMFQAGVQGFVDWYADAGSELVGEEATLDSVDAYTVGDLTEATIAHLPVDDEILTDPDEETFEPRDLTRAKGVVSLDEMSCAWTEAEALLVRQDQDVIFEDDFEGYERTYLSSRATFEGGAAALEFDAIDEELLPFGADFDRDAVGRSLLMTENMVDPSAVLTANMDPYPMNLDLRHGLFEIDGEELGVLAIITYNIGAAWGSGGKNALLQGFSVEINVERPEGRTLRMLAVWSEPLGGGIDPDSAIALNFAVNKSLKASERLSAVCAGDEVVAAE
jgi:hypothetical protein